MSSDVSAERESATPITGETVTLFGVVYTVEGVDVMNTAWQGLGGLENNCGLGAGFKLGASPATDQILLADECDSNGEDIAILTGVDPVTFQPTAALTTSSYIVDADAGGSDPSGIEWITDSGTMNYRFPRGVQYQMVALDASGIPYSNYDTRSDTDNANDGYKGLAACKNDKGSSATRMYYGGVDTDSGDHFAYMAFDLTTNSFVSDHSVLLDGIGTPDDSGQPDRALRGLAFDGTYYYVMVKKPGVNESWLYRYNSFPDPLPGADSAHPDGSPLSAQLDNASGGVAWPLGVGRPDRGGIACGRMVEGSPVFYVLCDTFLYTLRPVQEGVVNGDFESGTSGWTTWWQRPGAWTPTTTLAPCPTSGGSGNCLEYNQDDLNGGVYQLIADLGVGETYSLSCYSAQHTGATNSTWAEIHLQANMPVNGSDTDGSGLGMVVKWDDFCAPTGWDSSAATACNLAATGFTAGATSYYLILKGGDGGGGGPVCNISFDDMSIQGALPVGDWMVY
jgi:hypothetical protein